jgi:hypothetical protein
MKQKYELSDIGDINHILGMRVTRLSSGDLYLDQQVYITDKLEQFKMSECNDTHTPAEAIRLSMNDTSELLSDSTEYRMIVGSLIYASVSTRPDITHTTNILSRFMQQPKKSHMQAAKRVLRYLKGTSQLGLSYSISNNCINNNNNNNK